MRERINAAMAPGAARNAIDCALWDLEARTTGVRAWRLAGLARPAPELTAYTISLGSPQAMARAAQQAGRPLLKLKLGGDDAARIEAVRSAVPHARLIVDANESWTVDSWAANVAACLTARVELIEQPFPADADGILEGLARPVPVCADESAHDGASLAALASRYDAVNIKLDKTGGLTGAMHATALARSLGLRVMLGCMVSTSLAMAPALLLAGSADIVDLDGPLMLLKDRDHGIEYAGSMASPPRPELWG
jgi:L-alanine-DL-glutamate epimerase-like enolase superfamily enzyme